MRKDVERLILQARRDLENARKNIRIEAFEVTAFLSHQAVEKYLKGAWIHKKRVRPPATHYLRELGEGLRIPKRLLAHLNYLNPDYTVSRYPDAANEFHMSSTTRRRRGTKSKQPRRWPSGSNR